MKSETKLLLGLMLIPLLSLPAGLLWRKWNPQTLTELYRLSYDRTNANGTVTVIKTDYKDIQLNAQGQWIMYVPSYRPMRTSTGFKTKKTIRRESSGTYKIQGNTIILTHRYRLRDAAPDTLDYPGYLPQDGFAMSPSMKFTLDRRMENQRYIKVRNY